MGPTAPTPVIIPPSLGWMPREVGRASDPVTWVSFYADANNQTRLFVPGAGATTTAGKIPTLLHLPHVLADFVLPRPQTCSDMFSEISRLVAVEDAGIDAAAFKFITDWLITASHAAANTSNKGKVSLSLAAATSVHPYFHEWAGLHVSGTMGAKPVAPVGGNKGPTYTAIHHRPRGTDYRSRIGPGGRNYSSGDF